MKNNTIDDLLEKMMHAMQDGNLWDSEAYSSLILARINEVTEDKRETVRGLAQMVNDEAKRESKRRQKKHDLIEEIVNFKG